MSGGMFFEDKKCRICGIADVENINIFNGNKSLANKMYTVYPIIIYENDPLPQHICKKCIINVNYMYNDIQRVTKMNNTWISNVRSIQPTNKYISILEYIEQSNYKAKTMIKCEFNENISVNIVQHHGDNGIIEKKRKKRKHKKSTERSKSKKAKKIKQDGGYQPTDDSIINDIKSKLELNGCTLLSVTTKKSVEKPKQKEIVETLPPIEIAEEFSEALIDNVPIVIDTEVERDELLMELDKVVHQCAYCQATFDTILMLAAHQQCHLQIRIPRIIEKKYLPKNARRGRIVNISDRQCIRCLNCWHIFCDNNSILDHWSLGQCDFFCRLCGFECPQNPKLLREHVQTEHGICYRSLRNQRLYGMPSVYETKPEILAIPITAKQPNELPTNGVVQQIILPAKNNVTCDICLRVFHNFKARNSHMRKHRQQPVTKNLVIYPYKTQLNNANNSQMKNNQTIPFVPTTIQCKQTANQQLHTLNSKQIAATAKINTSSTTNQQATVQPTIIYIKSNTSNFGVN